MLIFIPARPYAAENRSSACWRPYWEDASCIKSFAKSKRLICSSQLWQPPQLDCDCLSKSCTLYEEEWLQQETCKYHKITKIAKTTKSPWLLRSSGMRRSEINLSDLNDLTNPSDVSSLSSLIGLSILSDLVLAILAMLWYLQMSMSAYTLVGATLKVNGCDLTPRHGHQLLSRNRVTWWPITGGRQHRTPAKLPKDFHEEPGRMIYRGRHIMCRRLWQTPRIFRNFSKVNNVIEQNSV